jgi:hypothetical protein
MSAFYPFETSAGQVCFRRIWVIGAMWRTSGTRIVPLRQNVRFPPDADISVEQCYGLSFPQQAGLREVSCPSM